MSRADSRRAHHLLAPLGVPARFGFGTAQSITDADGDTLVLPDGIPDLTSDTAEEELTTGVQIEPDPNQPNQPIPMLTVCGPVAADERVAWVSLPSGPSLVVGSVGAQARLIGAALVAGGRTDQTVTNNTDTDVTDLSCEVEVAHPDHLLICHTTLDVTNNDGSARSFIGRIKRVEESDEGDSATTEVGRYFRSSSLGAGVTSGATRPCVDIPDPGAYTYKATMQALAGTGFTIVTAPVNSTPSFSASLLVYDCGPLPEGYTLVG